jgi:soluble epoxide hydrolase/lipid-phosphate phosphatase
MLSAAYLKFSPQYVSGASNFTPNEALSKINPSFSYQVFLGKTPEAAAKEMNADIRSSIRSCAQIANSTLPKDFLQRNDTFLGPWRELQKTMGWNTIPASGIMSAKVEDYMVKSYSKQGFYNSKPADCGIRSLSSRDAAYHIISL